MTTYKLYIGAGMDSDSSGLVIPEEFKTKHKQTLVNTLKKRRGAWLANKGMKGGEGKNVGRPRKAARAMAVAVLPTVVEDA